MDATIQNCLNEEGNEKLDVNDECTTSLLLQVSAEGEKGQQSEQERFQSSQTSEINSDSVKNVTKAEQVTIAKSSRELKLLLELSKESNLDTNISYKRKSVEANRCNQQGSPIKINIKNKMSESGKRFMRSQNPDFVVKQQKFLSKVTNADGDSEHSNSDSDERRRRKSVNLSNALLNAIEDEFEESTKKIKRSKGNKDAFCWRCHREDVQISCATCVRSFHLKCLKMNVSNPDHWPCPECTAILRAENTQNRSSDMPLEQICTLLKFAHRRMSQCADAAPFLHPVNEKEFPEYSTYIICPMDLTKLENNIKQNLYGSTTAFQADAKWLLHNSVIFNSCQAKVTTMAKNILKVCHQEMQEIRNCPNCYLNANTKQDWFVEVCPQPHLLVWAKLKGFPYWPAKIMTTNSSGMVDVRFFGAHDRAWVPFKECFLYTRKDPNSNKQKRSDIIESMKEVDVHINKLKEVYGEFQYPPYRTPLDLKCLTDQFKLFIPSYTKQVQANQGDILDSTLTSEISPNCKSFSSESSTNITKNDDYESDEYCILDGQQDSEEGEYTNKSEEFETQVELPSVEPFLVNKNMKIKIKLSNEESGELKNIRLSTDDYSEPEMKKIRRNSDVSNSSRISEKISKLDISENMEISLDNVGQVSIVENINSLEEESRVIKKPIQLDIENREFSISPNNKCSIADHLIRKLTETPSIEHENNTKEVSTEVTFSKGCKNNSHEETVLKNMSEEDKNAVDCILSRPEITLMPATSKSKEDVNVLNKIPESMEKEPTDSCNLVDIVEIKTERLSDSEEEHISTKKQFLSTLHIAEKNKINSNISRNSSKEKLIDNNQTEKKHFKTVSKSKDKEVLFRNYIKKNINLTKVKKTTRPVPQMRKINLLNDECSVKKINSTVVENNLAIHVVNTTTPALIMPSTSADIKVDDTTKLNPNQKSADANMNPQMGFNVMETANHLNSLSDISPDNLSKAISDLMCRPLPKLQPRPLAHSYNEGLPSTTGAVSAKINSVSYRLTDYFRGMLLETLQELGTEDNPEATITNLKCELETLKQKHKEELLEIKKNINSVLKDIQKSMQEERQCLIDKTKAACEAETVRRVQEAKSKQWCANCFKEAYLYCCWNTSYCEYNCQKIHWAKHMIDCQNHSTSPQQSSSSKITQPILFKQTSQKNKSLLNKPTKLICRNTNNGLINNYKNSTANHITIVESIPGKYELVGKGSISVGGKIVTNSTNLLTKIKSGKIITVASPSNNTSTQQNIAIPINSMKSPTKEPMENISA